MPPISTKPYKRRVIEDKSRKKALFSCDRCKTKKIGCRRITDDQERIEVDLSVDCVACKKAGVECKTTIERKRKNSSPVENINLHYKCLLALVDGIFPHKDVNNIDILILLGISLGITMPSRNGETNKISDKLKFKSDNVVGLIGNHRADECSNCDDSNNQDNEKYSDCFVIDQDNTPHYVGSLGAMNFLANTVNIMVLKNNLELFLQKYQLINDNDVIISSKQKKIDYNVVKESYYLKFPYFYCITRNESDYYVTEFFKKIHPFCFCFDYSSFHEKYDLFWEYLNGFTISGRDTISNSFICAVYIIWILAELQDSAYQPKRLFPFIKERLLEIIKICLSEMILTPSLDGIRCMFMLALYFDVNCRKESGYLLLKLACQQALAIGLGRDYVLETPFPENNVAYSMRCMIWSLFQHESRISNQFGRSSTFNIFDLTTPYPTLGNVGLNYNYFFIENIKLSKILNRFLSFRSSVGLEDIISDENINKILDLKYEYELWYQTFTENYDKFQDESVGYRYHLMFQYHYYYISILFPYLLHSSNNISTLKNTLVQKLVCSCLKSSMDVSTLLLGSKETKYYHNILNYDMALSQYASTSLILGFIILLNEKMFSLVTEDLNIELGQIKTSMYDIKKFNDECQAKLKGSARKISRLVDVLLSEYTNSAIEDIDLTVFSHFTDFSSYSLDPEIPIV